MKWWSYSGFVAIVAALTGLLLGLDTGAISGALPLIKQQMNVDNPSLLGLVVSIMLFGALLGAVIGGPISRWLGRKSVIVVSTMLFVLCAILSTTAQHIYFLIGVRFFLGIAVGMVSFIAPLYLSEISAQEVRGRVVAVYQLMITVGLLAAFISDTLIAPTLHWRWMLGVIAIPSLIMLFLSLFLPRSPRWLVMQGREQEARSILARMSINHNVDHALRSIHDSFVQHSERSCSVLKRRFIQLLALGFGLQLMQQWTGINAIMYFSPTVFKDAGFSSFNQQMWCTVAVGVINVLTTFIAIRYVDRWGRRPILLGGLILMFLSLCVISYVLAAHSAALASKILGVSSILVYIFGFAVSLGPIVWLLCSEIFPLRYRDMGVVLTTASNWLFNSFLSQNFLFLVNKIHVSYVFVLFSVMCVLGMFFVYFFVPETKGVSLEQIESNVASGQPLRHIGC